MNFGLDHNVGDILLYTSKMFSGEVMMAFAEDYLQKSEYHLPSEVLPTSSFNRIRITDICVIVYVGCNLGP